MAMKKAEEQEEPKEPEDSGTATSSGDARTGQGLSREMAAETEVHGSVVEGSEEGGDRERRSEEREEDEEGRAPVGIREPREASKAERAEHELTHTPYRDWCPHCVVARGRNRQHRMIKDKNAEVEVPRVAIDYFFMSYQDTHAPKNPHLVVIDEQTGEKFARATGVKGMGDDGEMTWLLKEMLQ